MLRWHRKGQRLSSAGVSAIVLSVLGLGGTLLISAASDWRMHPTGDFPLAGGNYANQRYSALDRINTSNVKQLGGAWFIRLEEGRRAGNLDATPIVVDGVMYLTSSMRNVLAI